MWRPFSLLELFSSRLLGIPIRRAASVGSRPLCRSPDTSGEELVYCLGLFFQDIRRTARRSTISPGIRVLANRIIAPASRNWREMGQRDGAIDLDLFERPWLLFDSKCTTLTSLARIPLRATPGSPNAPSAPLSTATDLPFGRA